MLSNGAKRGRSAQAHDYGSRRRRVIRIVVPVVRMILLAGLVMAVWHLFPGGSHQESTPRREASPTETSGPIRTEYPLSLIPGGIGSDADFETARASDRVLAAHYADVGFLYPARFSQDRWYYASFRQNNNSVVWTNSPILVHAGESVFSDRFGNLVRGRCGNRLSQTPRTPVARMDPAEIVSEAPEIDFAPPPLPDDSGADYDIAPLEALAPVEPPPATNPTGTRIVTTAALPQEWPPDSSFDTQAIFGIFGAPGLARKPVLPRTAVVPEPATSLLTLVGAIVLMGGTAALRASR